MSSDDSNKDSNTPKRVFRPNSIINSYDVPPEDHNLFVSVTLLRTGEIMYLDRINTNTQIRQQHYFSMNGPIRFSLDPLGQLDPAATSKIRLGLNDVTGTDFASGMAMADRKFLFYYTGSEPVGYSFPDVNITVFIATDEEEKVWNIQPKVPVANKSYAFWDKASAGRNDDEDGSDFDDSKGEGKEKRVYEPRPPFAANPGPHVVGKASNTAEEKSDKTCVIS